MDANDAEYAHVRLHWQTRLAVALGTLALLTGCGSSKTETVSASGPSPAKTGSSSRQTAPAKGRAAGSGQAKTSGTGGTGAGASTRTATAPAFTKTEGQPAPEGLAAALATVKAHGYTATQDSDYRPQQTLRVLIATRTDSEDGHGQRAFFFVNGRYVGTDTSEPSATVKLVSQSDTEVTLAYPLYRAHDPLCCPGGGQATVRYQLNNGRLVALDTIPPASSRAG